MTFFSGHAIQRKYDQLAQSRIAKFVKTGACMSVAGFYSAAFLKQLQATISAFAAADIACYDAKKCALIVPSIAKTSLQAQQNCYPLLLEMGMHLCLLAAVGIQTSDLYRVTRAELDNLRQ